jgi:hypothetical protein
MLKQNQTINAQYPFRLIGGAFAGERTMFGRTSLRNFTVGEGINSQLAGIPSGHLAPSAWVLPYKPGAMASRNSADGVASLTGAGALGRNVAAAIAGTASLSAIAELIVSATASIAGVASVSGNVLAALQMAAALAASGNATGALGALGFVLATIDGATTVSAVPRANGSLAALIEVGATGELTAGGIATELLDVQLVETGLTVRETLRLCVAALAGKVSGAAGTTITFRNAVADNKDRIVATVDSNGNRSAITIDVT